MAFSPNGKHPFSLHLNSVANLEYVTGGSGEADGGLLGTINHCDFRVVKAIPLHIDMHGATAIASWRQIDEFGTGKSTSMACDDLGQKIPELFNTLDREAYKDSLRKLTYGI